MFACDGLFYVFSVLRTASYVTTSALQRGAALPRGVWIAIRSFAARASFAFSVARGAGLLLRLLETGVFTFFRILELLLM